MGDVQRGLDNIDKNDIDVSLLPEIKDFTIPVSIGAIRRDNVNGGDIAYSDRFEVNPVTHTGQTIKIITISFNSWYATAGILAG